MHDADKITQLREALNLSEHPYADRLGWLDALLNELEQGDFIEEHEDPDAAAQAVHECRALAQGLRAAFAEELETVERSLGCESTPQSQAEALEEVPF